MSFPQIYFGTLLAFQAQDYFRVFNAHSMWDSFPPSSTWSLYHAETSSWKLILVSLFIMTPILFIWRSLLKRFVFGVLAKKCAGAEPGTKLYDKFVEQTWLAFHYGLISVLGAYVLHDEPWFPPLLTKQARMALLAPLHDRMQDQEDLGLQILYLVQLGFYFMELITLCAFRENRARSDAVVYFFHHVYTVFLLLGSWLTLDHRIGSIVLFLHDVGDVFLPVGKCFTYSEPHVRSVYSWQALKLVKACGLMSFVVFVIMFAIPRLFFFGGIVYTGMYELHWGACCGLSLTTGICSTCPTPLFTALLMSVLGLLLPMHVFWFYLIVKMAYRLVLGKYQDVRSDDENDADGLPRKTSRKKR